MNRYMRSLLLSLLAPALLLAAAEAASFPVSATDETGVTRWGYISDSGSQITEFIYSTAGEFGQNGLAAVTNEEGQLALLHENGTLATDWLEMPRRVTTDGRWQALEYDGYTEYYDSDGSLVGSVEGAVGFPGDGLVVTTGRAGRRTLYGYSALRPEPAEAGTEDGAAGQAAVSQDQTAEKETPAEAGEKSVQPEAAAPKDGGAEAEDSAAKPGAASEEDGKSDSAPEEERYAIEPQYLAAGGFRDGRALVQTERGDYAVINTRGQVLRELPEGTTPTALDIYDDHIVILEMQGKYALYSLDNMQFATSFSYDEILPFDRRAARCRVGNLWGLITASGSVVIEPTYPYLSYMGEGVYAARGTDPGAAAVSETGKVLYSTGTYVGGFQTFAHGYSWHGRLDGSVVFFNTIGTIAQPVSGADDPQVMTAKVARVTRDGVDSYIDIRSGQTIYSNDRSYDLGNGMELSAETYEKYLGMRRDGTEYGYHVEYPQLSGHSSEAVQAKINDKIRSFFVSGPSGEQERSLDVTFGFSVEGRVLVVWANGVSGLDTSAVIWNDSIGLDLVTGDCYTAYDSLFHSGAAVVLSGLLPEGAPYYAYPRIDSEGVTFFRNHPAERGALPYAESVHLTFQELAGAVDFSGSCYRALTAGN